MRAATSTMTARLIAEWMSFVGWLHTAVRKDSRALALFADAEDLAGLQGRPRGAIRASATALATPGADPTQHTYDLLQTAQAYLRTSRTPSG